MISLNDYTSHDGLGLAELVARKEVTPDELAAAALEAVMKVNPKINAVLHTLPKESAAEIRAGLPRGAFSGVPFMIKELVLHAKGVRCEIGSRLVQRLRPEADTELMARFRHAGRCSPAPRRRPSSATIQTTETRAFGPVHNPWDLGRSAGAPAAAPGAASRRASCRSPTPTTAADRFGFRRRATACSALSPRVTVSVGPRLR